MTSSMIQLVGVIVMLLGGCSEEVIERWNWTDNGVEFQLKESIILDYFSTEQNCHDWRTYRDKDEVLHVYCAYALGKNQP